MHFILILLFKYYLPMSVLYRAISSKPPTSMFISFFSKHCF